MILNDIDPEVNHSAEIFPDVKNSEHSDYYSIDKFNENCVTNVNDLNIIPVILDLYMHIMMNSLHYLAFFVLNLTFYVSLRVG